MPGSDERSRVADFISTLGSLTRRAGDIASLLSHAVAARLDTLAGAGGKVDLCEPAKSKVSTI